MFLFADLNKISNRAHRSKVIRNSFEMLTNSLRFTTRLARRRAVNFSFKR